MQKSTIVIALLFVAGASATPTPFIGDLITGAITGVHHEFAKAGDWMKNSFDTTFSKFSEFFATQISNIQEIGKSLSADVVFLAGFFEAEVKSALESISLEFGKIYNAVPNLITDRTASIQIQINDFNSKIKKMSESGNDKLIDLALGLLQKFDEVTATTARLTECSKEFLDTSLPQFANTILPEMTSCVEISATNNATDIVSNAFGKFKDELLNVERIGDIIGENVTTCIVPPDATNTNESLLKCVKAVLTYLVQKESEFTRNIVNEGVNVASSLISAVQKASNCMTTQITKATTMAESIGAGIDSCLSNP